MMKKVWLVLLAVVLVFGLVMLGCGSKSSGKTDPDEPGDETPPYSFEGPFTYELWGSNKPSYDEATGLVTFSNVTGSMGFVINFADINYTYDAKDILVFTYYIEVTTPVAVLIAKTPSMADLGSSGGAGWGRGKGWEYALGDATRSVYDGPLVSGTWDPATKTGTFEVLMKIVPKSATGIGFQHNFWADTNGDGVKIAEHSEYSLKFTKIENKVAPAGEGDGDGDGDDELTEEQQEDAFDAAVGIKALVVNPDATDAAKAILKVDTENGIIYRDDTTAGNWGAWVSVGIPAASLPIIASDTIKITYIGIGNALITLKQSNSDTDFNGSNQYQTLTGDGTVKTLLIPAVRYGAAIPTEVWTFSSRPPSEPWKVKIINIEVVHGDPIKIDLSVSGLKPVSGATPVETVETLQYSGTVDWTGTLDGSGKFVLNTEYTATITLTKKTGFTFTGIEANTFTVVGAKANGVTHETGTDTLTITAAFPGAIAPDPVTVWQPVFTAGMTITDGAIDGFGIQPNDKPNCTLATIDGGFTATATSGSWKTVKIFTPNAGGDNYYTTPNGFTACTNGETYTMTFMASVGSGTGQVRLAGNNGSTWAETELDTVPKAVTYSWTQTGGNFNLDTGNTATNVPLIITGLKVTTP